MAGDEMSNPRTSLAIMAVNTKIDANEKLWEGKLIEGD